MSSRGLARPPLGRPTCQAAASPPGMRHPTRQAAASPPGMPPPVEGGLASSGSRQGESVTPITMIALTLAFVALSALSPSRLFDAGRGGKGSSGKASERSPTWRRPLRPGGLGRRTEAPPPGICRPQSDLRRTGPGDGRAAGGDGSAFRRETAASGTYGRIEIAQSLTVAARRPGEHLWR